MTVEDEIIVYLSQNKLRPSPKKLLVARQLSAFRKEVTAETLWMSIRQNRLHISVASVYQALNWMVELGFASRRVKDRKSVYQIKATALTESSRQ